MTELVRAAGVRTASLNQRGTSVRYLKDCLAAGAWLDAALRLLSIERPGWTLRRLVREDGVWYCSLSRAPNIPIEFDDTVDASHPDPAIAIMLGILAGHKEEPAPSLTRNRIHSPDGCIAMCCDNFS
jgi:hypothetical protein